MAYGRKTGQGVVLEGRDWRDTQRARLPNLRTYANQLEVWKITMDLSNALWHLVLSTKLNSALEKLVAHISMHKMKPRAVGGTKIEIEAECW